jgi:hypothetical protein
MRHAIRSSYFGTFADNLRSDSVFSMGRGGEHARNDINYHPDTATGRRSADLGLFKRLGLLSRRHARHHFDHRYCSGPDGTDLDGWTGRIKRPRIFQTSSTGNVARRRRKRLPKNVPEKESPIRGEQ